MTAHDILKIVEETVGKTTDIPDFLYHVGNAIMTGRELEYRFQGKLGFGGKLWLNKGCNPRVTCYKEDWTPEIGEAILHCNNRLFHLYKSDLKNDD